MIKRTGCWISFIFFPRILIENRQFVPCTLSREWREMLDATFAAEESAWESGHLKGEMAVADWNCALVLPRRRLFKFVRLMCCDVRNCWENNRSDWELYWTCELCQGLGFRFSLTNPRPPAIGLFGEFSRVVIIRKSKRPLDENKRRGPLPIEATRPEWGCGLEWGFQ